MNPNDNSWLSERTKTWIISITMFIIVGGVFWGYWAANNWRADREADKAAAEIEMVIDIIKERGNPLPLGNEPRS